MKNQNIYIIGAGISGLIAAQVLEKKGYAPKIIEATDRVGGRVKTDFEDGYLLDHGFQVLLSAYPYAKKYLDYEKLDLQYLLPGAFIFSNNGNFTMGNPLREFSFLFSSIFNTHITLTDKFKLLKLNKKLKKATHQEIFSRKEISTLLYLKEFGFSEKIIISFFKPFFSGIFLEPDLRTSSRMFEFVYKMFLEGDAVIPKKGMEMISKQLLETLSSTSMIFNSKVKSVIDNKIVLSDNKVLDSDYTIIATDASQIIPSLKKESIDWKSCETLYFETEKRIISKPMIGLISNQNALINNIIYSTSICNSKVLISVTIVKTHKYSKEDLIAKVKMELLELCDIQVTKLVKYYKINKALPDLINLQYEMSTSEYKLTDTIFIAGDTLLNSSLNAAMASGENAAKAVLKMITKK